MTEKLIVEFRPNVKKDRYVIRIRPKSDNAVLFRYQCSSNQERYIFASQKGDLNYHLPLSFLLRGDIDLERLKICLHRAVRDEDALNVIFESDRDGRCCAKRMRDSVAALHHGRFKNSAAMKQHLRDFIYERASAFQQSLCKFHVAEIEHGDTILTISLHHSVCDGVSLGLFLKKISDLYNSGPTEAAPERQRGYGDLIADYRLRHGEWTDAERSFWLESSAQDTESAKVVPDSESPAIGERRAIRRFINKQQYSAIQDCAHRLSVTPFHFVYAAYLIMLSRYGDAGAVSTTFQSSGRRAKREASSVIGQFSNALALTFDLGDALNFADLCALLKQQVHRRIDYERYPYHEFIRETGQHPRFGVNWYPEYDGVKLNGAACEEVQILEWNSDYEFNLHGLTSGGGLVLKISYSSDRFSDARMETFLEQLENLLHDAARDPTTRLTNIALRTEGDRVLPDLTAELPRREPDLGLYDQFCHAAEHYADRTALRVANDAISYGELSGRVQKFGDVLAAAGVVAGSTIAIVASRTPGSIVAMLAALKLRAPFALLDSAYPPERLRDCLGVFSPDILVFTSAAVEHDAALSECARVVVRVGGSANGVAASSDLSLRTAAADFDGVPAYYLFTSGSTGAPKCVAHGEAPLLNFLHWHIATQGFDLSTQFAMTSGLGHDPLMRDIFTPLTLGATLHIPAPDFARKPTEFAAWVMKSKINVLHCTPQLITILGGRTDQQPYNDLTHVFFGGDRLNQRTVALLSQIAPACRMMNFFGATETPQAATAFIVDPRSRDDVVPIGKGVAGAQGLVLRENGALAGIGEIGEIAIRSRHLALGYLNSDDATRRFVDLAPTSSRQRNRAYKTGDRGFYLPTGDIKYLGRIDQQVKIRGFRVEINDVENAFQSISEVDRAVIIPIERDDGEHALAAYILCARGAIFDDSELRNLAARLLPDYMIPSSIVELKEVPLTPNGKIDKARLPPPLFASGSAALKSKDHVPPASDSERAIVDELKRLTGADRFGVNARFVDFGLDSLSYVNASMALENIVGRLPADWERLSIRELGNLQGRKSWMSEVEIPILLRALAIIAVVASHFGLIAFGGAVGALLLVAGHSFGRFQISALHVNGDVRSILQLVLKVAVPTVLYTILLQLVFSTYDLSAVLLFSNFFTPDAAGGFSFWFVMVLVQNLLLLAGLLSIPTVRRATVQNPFHAAVLALVVFYALRQAGPFIWDTDYLFDRVPHMQLWLMALGWCVAQADTLKRHVLVAGLTAAIIMAEIFRFGGVQPILLAALIAIPLIRRVPAPRVIGRVINIVASASLFIYLTHFQARSLIEKTPLGQSDWVSLAGALAIGVVCHLAWEKLTGPAALSRLKAILPRA